MCVGVECVGRDGVVDVVGRVVVVCGVCGFRVPLCMLHAVALVCVVRRNVSGVWLLVFVSLMMRVLLCGGVVVVCCNGVGSCCWCVCVCGCVSVCVVVVVVVVGWYCCGW